MLIRRADQMDGQPVEMEGVKDVSMRLMVSRADGAPNFAMRHFTVEPGGHTPRHHHAYEHEVFVVDGAGRLEYDGEHHAISAGDVVYVAPGVMHQFVNVGDAPLAFLCLVPTSYDCGGGDTATTPGS